MLVVGGTPAQELLLVFAHRSFVILFLPFLCDLALAAAFTGATNVTASGTATAAAHAAAAYARRARNATTRRRRAALPWSSPWLMGGGGYLVAKNLSACFVRVRGK